MRVLNLHVVSPENLILGRRTSYEAFLKEVWLPEVYSLQKMSSIPDALEIIVPFLISEEQHEFFWLLCFSISLVA